MGEQRGASGEQSRCDPDPDWARGVGVEGRQEAKLAQAHVQVEVTSVCDRRGERGEVGEGGFSRVG